MSFGAEYLAETEWERNQQMEMLERLYERALNDCMQRIWRTKDGSIMSVSEMTESHIQNCINMLERNNHPYKGHYIAMFKNELSERRTDG